MPQPIPGHADHQSRTATRRWRGLTAIAVSALLLLACTQPPPSSPCQIGFDVGSSGIRAGDFAGNDLGRVSIDYLADVWANSTLEQTKVPTLKALRDMGGAFDCTKVAGGYSAWRLAVEKGGADKMADSLALFHDQTGVAGFVIPQNVEGSYGYYAAQAQLGQRLRTPYIWDIGGGSMQIASRDQSWGSALGQKAWLKRFCQTIKGSDQATCRANPVGGDAADRSQEELAPDIAQAKAALGGDDLSVTAVSTLVVKTMHPILRYLSHERGLIGGQVGTDGFDLIALNDAIALLADKDDRQILTILDGCRHTTPHPICTPQFAATFVTDMILVRSFIQGLSMTGITVAEASITNVPGILVDRKAQQWHGAYDCYLIRLRRMGIAAYETDPATCRPAQ